MPSTPWRRRRSTDSPRPAGRRWAGRLRRGGTLARQALLVRVNRRSGDSGRAATATRAEVIYTGPDPVQSRALPAAPRAVLAEPGLVEHGLVEHGLVEPGLLEPGAPVATTVPLLPGAQTTSRRLRFALVNACTLASLSLGLLAIFLAMQGDVRPAAACLVACVASDLVPSVGRARQVEIDKRE